MFKPKKPTRPKKVGDTDGNDVDMDIEGNGSCLETIKSFWNGHISKKLKIGEGLYFRIAEFE